MCETLHVFWPTVSTMGTTARNSLVAIMVYVKPQNTNPQSANILLNDSLFHLPHLPSLIDNKSFPSITVLFHLLMIIQAPQG